MNEYEWMNKTKYNLIWMNEYENTQKMVESYTIVGCLELQFYNV